MSKLRVINSPSYVKDYSLSFMIGYIDFLRIDAASDHDVILITDVKISVCDICCCDRKVAYVCLNSNFNWKNMIRMLKIAKLIKYKV